MSRDNSEPAFTQPLSEQGQAALDQVRARRGYTLPYHRLFAAHAPELLNNYDTFYQSLTLTERILTAYERETVWATLLAAAREAHGFIHMQRALDAGLSNDDLSRCVAIAALCNGFDLYSFAGENWAAWTHPDDLQQQYLSVFDRTTDGLPNGLAHMAAVSAMAARRNAAGTVVHLGHALDAGCNQAQLTEALSYMLIPCGANALIDAISAWESAATDGVLPPPY